MFLSDINEICFRKILEKQSNIKFHENPSRGGEVVPCGQTDEQTDGQTNVMNLTDARLNFTKAPQSKAPNNFTAHFKHW